MLSTAAAAAVNDSLAQLRAATARIEGAAAGASAGLAGWWAGIIGADSTTAALRSQAAAARNLLDVMETKARTLLSDDDARAFVLVVSEHTDTSNAESVAAFLRPSTAVREVAAGTARDLVGLAGEVGQGWIAVLKASPYLLAAFGLFWLWTWTGKRRAR